MKEAEHGFACAPHGAGPMTSHQATRSLPDESATVALAGELALFARAGDCMCLIGDLGSGKTALARAFIAALAPPGAVPEVPSPTFTLVQTYDVTRVAVAHFDFYRLSDPAELAETGFHDFLQTHLTLVEWADRLASELPADRLEIGLEIAGAGRIARLTGYGEWRDRLRRLEATRSFIAEAGWQDARRLPLDVDASARRYERLVAPGGASAVVMDMAPRSEAPAIGQGRSYGATARLAADCRAVVAVNAGLRAAGLSAPELYHGDLARGLLLIEDLGDQVYGRMMAANQDMSEPMLAAVLVLGHIAGRDWPRRVPLPDGSDYEVPGYDDEALEIEVELLVDWFWPLVKGEPASAEVRSAFERAWQGVLAAARTDRPVWVLRDYHSPNLVWLPDRQGLQRVGLVDTQDCVFGHPAYDLAALLQDARVDIPRVVAGDLFDYYCALRQADEGDFDQQAFEAAYAVLGAQRATKILGIFTRLSRRDGKHGYLRHLHRVSKSLEINLSHPVLAPVRAWFDRHLPAAERDAAVARVLRKA